MFDGTHDSKLGLNDFIAFMRSAYTYMQKTPGGV
jgi:hypothetical protein